MQANDGSSRRRNRSRHHRDAGNTQQPVGPFPGGNVFTQGHGRGNGAVNPYADNCGCEPGIGRGIAHGIGPANAYGNHRGNGPGNARGYHHGNDSGNTCGLHRGNSRGNGSYVNRGSHRGSGSGNVPRGIGRGNCSGNAGGNGRGRGNAHDVSYHRTRTSAENVNQPPRSRDHMYGSNQSLPAMDYGRNSNAYAHPAEFDFPDDARFDYDDDDRYSIRSNDSSSHNRSKSAARKNSKSYSEDRTYPKIAVYWDIENCQIPKGKSALFFVKRIRDCFYEGHVEHEFVAVCDTSKQSKTVLEELNYSSVDVINVNADCKNAADDVLRRRLRDFGEHGSSPATVVLITGDVNFVSDIHHLRHKKRFNVILLYNSHANVALTISANNNQSFETFVTDLPDTTASQQHATAAASPSKTDEAKKLVVANLAPEASLDELKKCLGMKFKNFKGNVQFVNMKTKTAFVHFSSVRDAQNAKARLKDEVVLGSKMRIFEWSEKKRGAEDRATAPQAPRAKATNEKTPRKTTSEDDGKTTSKVTPLAKSSMLVMKTKNFSRQGELAKILRKNELVMTDVEGTGCGEVGVKWLKITCPSQNFAKKLAKTLKNSEGVEQAEVHAADWKPESPTVGSNPIALLRAQLLERRAKSVETYEHKLGELHGRKVALMDTSQSLHVTPGVRKQTADANDASVKNLAASLKLYNDATDSLLARMTLGGCDYKKLPADFEVECNLFEQFLPVYLHRAEIVSAAKNKRVVVVIGPQGCGKATQLIQYVYHDGFADHGKIVCVEPHKELVGIVGSQVAGQLKNHVKGKSSQVMFSTDRLLLQEINADSLLKGYSCVIVDRVQEKCPLTELLLAYLRKISGQREDLFVFVLTTPDRSVDLTRFFNGASTVKIDATAYPVIPYWDTLGEDFVRQAVETVLKILSAKHQGNVLVILPSPSDVHEGVRTMRESAKKWKKVQVLPLIFVDGFKDNWKQLQRCTANGTKTVVFTVGDQADVASNAGSFRFVVDVGLVERTVSGTSHVVCSTEYLKGVRNALSRSCKAGHEIFGECHHLYPSDVMNGLDEEDVGAETRCLPGIVLNLLKSKQNPMLFDFVSSPSVEQVSNVLEFLAKKGAVADNEITSLGEKMALLPLPFHLSLLLLKGVDEKVGYETLLLCAVSEVTSSFANVVDDAREFRSANVLKVTEVYMRWERMNKSDREKYVVTEKLNPVFMSAIYEKAIEIHAALKSAGVKLKCNCANPDWRDALQKLVLEHWPENFCYRNGNEDETYTWQHRRTDIVLKLGATKDAVSNGVLPGTIVFERLWEKHSEKHVYSYVAIEPSVLQTNADALGLDDQCLDNLVQESVCIRPVGHHLIRSKIIGASEDFLKQLEKCLSQSTGVPVNIVPTLRKGQIVLHVPRKHKERVRQAIVDRLDEGRELLLKQEWQYMFGESGLSVVWGAGGAVKHLLTPKQYISVIFFLPSEADAPKVLAFCKEHGQYVHFSVNPTKNSNTSKFQMTVMFATPDGAANAYEATTRNKAMAAKPRIPIAFVPLEIGALRTSLRVSWVRRRNKGTAIVRFTGDSIYKCIGPLAKNIQDHVRLRSSKPVPDFSSLKVVLNNVDPLLVKSVVLEAVNACLRETDVTLDDSELELFREDPFRTGDEEFAETEGRLSRLLADASRKKLKVALDPPGDEDDAWHATVAGFDTDETETLTGKLPGAFGGLPLRFTEVHTWSLVCAEKLFRFCADVVLPQFKRNLPVLGLGEVRVSMREDARRFYVKLESSSRDELLSAMRCLAQLLKPRSLEIDAEALPDDVFVENGRGRAFLDRIEQTQPVFLQYKKNKKQLVFLGPESVKQEIQEFLKVEAAKLRQAEVETVVLPFYDVNVSEKGLLRKLIEEFGPFLTGLASCTGLLKLKLNVRSRELSVTGTSGKIPTNFLEKLVEVKEMMAVEKESKSDTEDDDVDICPVCGDNVHHCEKHYRLEYCGHAYCLPCMRALMANGKPPYVCLYEGCSDALVFRDLNTFKTKHEEMLAFLKESSLRELLESRPFAICPFPDCEGIVKVANACQNCPSCFNDVCTSCQTLYHYEETCDFFQQKTIDAAVAELRV